MNAELIAVGSEILIGDICNTHSQYLSKQLALLGVNVLLHTTVGDNPTRLKKTLDSAVKRSDLIILTGGLGPTMDDLTKETVCKCCSLPLFHDPITEKRIRDFFDYQKKEMPQTNRKQALIPRGAVVFDNHHGTAPGMAVTTKGVTILMLPGPPNELIPMFEQKVIPYLRQFSNSVILSHNLHFFGIGESKVDEILSDLLSQQNPTIGLYAKEGEVRARISAKAATATECEELLTPIIHQIQQRLGSFLYGIDCESLERAVVMAALSKGKEIAVAESCTGGMIASKITSVPGASNCFRCGIVSYSNQIKQNVLGVTESALFRHGAVSPQVAEEMASRVRSIANADIGISTTGIAGPSGGSEQKPVGLVYVGIATPSGCKSHRLLLSRGLSDERESIRIRSSLFALNAARLALETL